MKRIIISGIISIIVAIIGAYATIQVGKMQTAKQAQEQDHPVAKSSAAKPAFEGHPAGATLNPLSAGPKTITPTNDGIMIITATASAKAGGTFRSYLDVLIKVGDTAVGQARSYVPVNWEIEHVVDASAVVPVFAGEKVTIDLSAPGEGLKGPALVRGTYAIVPLPK